MIEHYTIVLDVGQTFIRCALMDQEGNILPDTFSIFSSKLDQAKETILNNIVKIIKFNINSVLHPNFSIQYICFSLPDSMYSKRGIQIIDEKILNNLLHEDPTIKAKLSSTCGFYFEKESRLFAIGEHILRKENQTNQDVLYVVIGSELSVSLVNNGNINHNFIRPISVDASSQKIIDLSQKYMVNQTKLTAKEIAAMALQGNVEAQKVYNEYGYELARYLKKIRENYSFDEVFIGGNIALSYPLFQKSLEGTIISFNVVIQSTKHTFHYVCFGISEQMKHISQLTKRLD